MPADDFPGRFPVTPDPLRQDRNADGGATGELLFQPLQTFVTETAGSGNTGRPNLPVHRKRPRLFRCYPGILHNKRIHIAVTEILIQRELAFDDDKIIDGYRAIGGDG